MSGEMRSGVSGGCEMLFWLLWLFTKKLSLWMLSLGAVVVRHSLSMMSRAGYHSQFNRFGT